MKTKQLIPLLAVLVLGAASPAQETGDDREADHQALRALRDKVTKAINEQDIDTLTSCMTRDFAFTTADQSILRSAEEVKAYYNDILSGARYEYPLESIRLEPKADILTEFIGEDAGYCFGSCASTYTIPNGQSVTVDSRWSALVTRENGEWKVRMAHAGVNFLDNPVLTIRDKLASAKLTTALIVAGLVVLILAVLLMRKRAHKEQ